MSWSEFQPYRLESKNEVINKGYYEEAHKKTYCEASNIYKYWLSPNNTHIST